jgi:hypothetical protein
MSLTEEEEVLNRLSEKLKEKFIIANNMKILGKVPFLQKNFSKTFLKKLSINLHKEVVNDGDIIFEEQNY